MLTVNDCVRRAQDACINLFGKDFVDMHKEGFCSTRYLDPDTGLFEYSLLYAPLEKDNEDDHRLLIDERPFDYFAAVLVDTKTGEVYVDPDKSKTRLPNQ